MDLSVVIPVYNESGRICRVIEEWTAELNGLGMSYEILVYDDGSSDATPQILNELAQRVAGLVVRRHENMGHGPTILRGYREATATWVLQVDGDGEIGASHFRLLWERRHEHDLLLGCRQDRRAPLARRLITATARIAVRLLFGGAVADVNSPYRLMRRDRFSALLRHVPPDAFAPNVLLTGLAVRGRLRIFQGAVPQHSHGGAGTGGILGWRAWRVAARSLHQLATVAIRDRLDREGGQTDLAG